jgi:hypothetical protein
METNRSFKMILVTALALLFVFAAQVDARQAATGSHRADVKSLRIASNEIGGVVNGAKGPEAGVWVIAETSDLPTKFRRIVVTDDQGRFLIPDLPKASYKVWVRGYGLVDSSPVESGLGKNLALKAAPAPDAKTAAQVYPANYWLSLLKIPPKSDFPASPAAAPSRPPTITSQAGWISQAKSGCQTCHQLGDRATREIEPELGKSDSSADAWNRRVKSGQMGPNMSSGMNMFGRDKGVAMYADWSDRIAAGEAPEPPPRPQGMERNVVLTEWEWGGATDWTHFSASTDKRNPTVNANGPVFGTAMGSGSAALVDPKTNTASLLKMPTFEDEDKGIAHYIPVMSGFEPSPYWGDKLIWKSVANPHNLMMDGKGRLWMGSSLRPNADQPAFCKDGANNPYAKMYPLDRSSRQLQFYDFKAEKWTQVNSCFSVHHFHFAEDEGNTLFMDGNAGYIGWLNTRVLDETGNQEKAQGWCPAYADVDGDGKFDPKVDRLIPNTYDSSVNPVDGSVWFAVDSFPGMIVRVDRGAHPPETCRTEIYTPPVGWANVGGAEGFTPHGIDPDRNGVMWVALGGSGHVASFDRRKCKEPPSNRIASGEQCLEGWTLYQTPGPTFKGTGVSAEFMYSTFVDQFDIMGLGKNTPIATGSGSDSTLVLDPKTSKWIVMRVPYPLGFYSRGLDGRIDDPKAGWKGRGLWAAYGTIPNWHIEGGKGTKPLLVHFQLRPNPLAN